MYCCAVVSDAACGGQLLMEATTFAAIKDRLEELGAVDEAGLNVRRINRRPHGWLARALGK